MQSNRLYLYIAAFASGVALMITELAGLRSFAPYLGSSITVTSAIVGVILASLCLGAFFGGKLVDAKPSQKLVTNCLLLAALFVGSIPWLSILIAQKLGMAIESVEIGSLICAVILFCPATSLIGAVVPICVKLLSESTKTLGASIGKISALSSAGSIVGTFLAGFILLPYVGIKVTFLVAAGILFLAALFQYAAFSKLKIFGLIVLVSSSVWPQPNQEQRSDQINLAEIDSLYSHIIIGESWNGEHDRRIRTLRTDPYTLQGARYLPDPEVQKSVDPFTHLEQSFKGFNENLAVPYTRFFRIGSALCQGRCRTLLIGGGAFSYPSEIQSKYPERELDVVEIDSRLVQVAKDFFELKKSPLLNIITEDGRRYLNNTAKLYDLIILDAYTSTQTIPHHLISLEALKLASDRLRDNGIISLNILSAIQGPNARFFESIYATIAAVFGDIFVFAVKSPDLATEVQNLVIVAAKNHLPLLTQAQQTELSQYLNHRWLGAVPNSAATFRDDNLLVERLSAELVRALKRNYAG